MLVLCLKLFFPIVLLLVGASEVPATQLKILTHSVAGYTYVDSSGTLRGKKHGGKRAFNLELVRELQIRLGVHSDFIEVPFKMGWQQVQSGPDVVFFNVSRTASREELVKWVGPLQLDTSYLYKMKDNPVQVNTLEEAKEVEAICVLRGGMHFNTLKKKGFNNLLENSSYSQCFQMLAAGRVSLTPSAEGSLGSKLKKAGVAPDQVEQTPVLVSKVGGYIAFSKHIPDSVIDQWQAALDALKRSGKYQQLYREYFLLTP